jgi:hypothetical protein
MPLKTLTVFRVSCPSFAAMASDFSNSRPTPFRDRVHAEDVLRHQIAKRLMLSIASGSSESPLRKQISEYRVCQNVPAHSGHDGIKEKK